MPARREATERRRHKRFQVNDLVIAVSTEVSSQFGKIVNISRGGLRIRYVSDQKPTAGTSELNILTDQFYISSVPCRIVWENEAENTSSFNNRTDWYCGLEFGDLSETQRLQLEELMSHFSRR